MNTKELLTEPQQQAETYVAPLGNHWLHIQSIIAKSREIGDIFNDEDRYDLIARVNFS
jgi:hypothetical protein